MSRLLKITDNGSGILVQGTDNVLYPDNATLTYPYNSIVLVTDESDIATFRSASNNDVLFSGLIGKIEIGGEIVTKQNINTKFDAIANQESGGGGGDVTGLFADASYDSQTKHINFYDKDNTLVAYVDATDFIKDGMVSNVEILNGNLVITFNTDAGHEDIEIPLSSIFNPSNYYTKAETEEYVSGFAYPKNKVDELLEGKADSANVYTKLETEEYVSGYTYSKGESDAALADKADADDVYTKAEADSAITEAVTSALEEIPISVGTSTRGDSFIGNDLTNNVASGNFSVALGRQTSATSSYAFAAGIGSTADGDAAFALGSQNLATANYAFANGTHTQAKAQASHAEGVFTIAQNIAEHADGRFNDSTSATTTWGDSGNTLYSLGNGYDDGSFKHRHNALEVKQNGDVYVAATNESGDYYNKPMIRLQDFLNNKVVTLTLAEYNNLPTKDASTIYIIY